MQQQSTQFDTFNSPGNNAIGDYTVYNAHDSSIYRDQNSTGMIMVSDTTAAPSLATATWKSRTKLITITDGLSQTLMIGEKHITRPKIGIEGGLNGSSTNLSGDGPNLGCHAYTLMRIAGASSLLANGPEDASNVNNHLQFGSWHPGICQFILGDGSVKPIRNDVDPVALARLATRASGTVISGDW